MLTSNYAGLANQSLYNVDYSTAYIWFIEDFGWGLLYKDHKIGPFKKSEEALNYAARLYKPLYIEVVDGQGNAYKRKRKKHALG